MNKKKSREDYLRIIYELEEDKIGARSIDLANELNISKPSVSEMIRKLAAENLIKISPYSRIFLTVKGKREAEKIHNKHFIIKRFVENFFEHDEELVEREAHELEHALSDESIKIISEMMNLGILREKLRVPGYVG